MQRTKSAEDKYAVRRAPSANAVIDELEERVKGMRLKLALDCLLRSGNMPSTLHRTTSENDAYEEPQRPAERGGAGKESAKPSYRDFMDLLSKGDDDSFGKLVSRLKPNAGRKQDAGSTTSTATAAGTPKERPPPATILRRCSSTPEGATDRGQEEHEREWGSEPSARNVRFASTHQVRIIPRRLLPFDA
mmetsp:Transcript_13915/g.33727  ORF Transcript_13915/g.33727 Transcript_13915/m.33727 type:complete len:190 (+) Transcript_13915:37-606(+)